MYVSLVVYGPSHAKSLVSIMEIGRVDVYRILRGLRKRGLVEVYLGSPSKFAAVDPKRALDFLTKEKENNLAELKKSSGTLKERLEAVSARMHAPDPRDDTAQNHFKLKFGRQVLDTREQLLNRANKEILVIWSGLGLKIHIAEGLLQTFERAAARGVKIRAITEFMTDDLQEIQLINKFATLRIGENLLTTLRSMIVDSREVLLSATSLPASQSELIALWTDNAAIVSGFMKDFDRLWDRSLPLDQHLLHMKAR